MTEETIEIISEESHFLLANKPAGLFSQAAPGVPSLEVQLASQLKVRDNHPGNPFVGLPQRLDRATSGIMLIARNRRALTRFGQQFQSRKVNKFYLAIVEGEFPMAVQHWEDYLRKIPDEPKAEVVSNDAEQAKLAQMVTRGLFTHQGRSLVLIQLLTGRMHQIRVQAAHRGFPVVDDRIYGVPSDADQDVTTSAALDRQCPHALHALRLEFRHPQTARAIIGTAAVPSHWQRLGDDFWNVITRVVSSSENSADSWQDLRKPT